MRFEKKVVSIYMGGKYAPKTVGGWVSWVRADCIILPEPTLEWLRVKVSDLSYVLIHHTNGWCINRLRKGTDTRFNLVPAPSPQNSGWVGFVGFGRVA